jgi:hypothetical protein
MVTGINLFQNEKHKSHIAILALAAQKCKYEFEHKKNQRKSELSMLHYKISIEKNQQN